MSTLEQPFSKFGKLGSPVMGTSLFAMGTKGAMGAAFVALIGSTGCISDTDCGVCDPDKLVLESISGINYSNRKVHLLSDGVTQGKYFIEDISACEETEDATDEVKAPRGAEEWCKLSPLVTWQGLEFVFNNLLDPTSIELVRKDPSNPQLFEIYDWKTQLAHIEGPVTRFNGDYVSQTGDEPDLITRAVNLTCVENLRDQGVAFSHTSDPAICNDFYTHEGRMIPLKMQVQARTDDDQPDPERLATIESYRGQSDWRAASCTAPDSGPDTCCTVCDYELSVNVAKYGVDGAGATRTPENALTCSPSGNVYDDCADFVVDVNRDDELNRYSYEWNGMVDTFRLPLSDKIRETHPGDRPDGVEPDGVPCQTDADCSERLGSDPGAVCIGTTPEGIACDAETDDCGSKHCKAEWFVGCNDDSLCVDRRFKDKGAGACFIATEDFVSCEPTGLVNCSEGGTGVLTGWGAGNRLARCDSGEFPDGNLDPAECCQQTLGAAQSGGGCDPLFQSNVVPVPRFDRDRTLPEETRDCFCGNPEGQAPDCAAQIEQMCTAPFGNLERHDGTSNEGQYVTRFITKQGGVIYDPALKGVLFLPADRGNQPRSLVETCSELAVNPDLIGRRNVQDGWRMHDDAFFETYENFDRGMCSASEYRVVFATGGEQIVDKVGNTLPSDQTTYVFQTPEFHVVPGTGFPTDNLRVGACDDFEMSLSNKYDLDPENLRKIELWQIGRIDGMDKLGEDCSTSLRPECWTEDFVVAGGRSCTTDPEMVSESTPPCLTVDVSLQREGNIRVEIDTVKFGIQLFNLEADPDQNSDPFGRTLTGRYRMAIPGLEGVEHFDDLNLNEPADREAYDNAFHDVCGMPLITKGGQNYTDFYYDFTIDEPKCKEDEDRDDVQLSCDNAREHYNPVQEDQDIDGFGDVVDLCQLTPSDSNTADSDKDGIGNDCDTCRQTVDKYFFDTAMVADPRMWVRNVPFQFDFDQDGIGDVCDNCVTVANCGVFNDENPHTVGVPVPYEQPGVCQTDANTDMIGDECFDPDTMMGLNDLENAAGPIGFEMIDDFDQDGIVNAEDWCTRQPIAQSYDERVTCTADADCPVNSVCALTPANNGLRYCNHADFDGDQVGDFCDTCPYKPNPMQVTDTGMQVDDEDADFVGRECETNSSCEIRKDPRPYAFMEVSVEGSCCTTSYPGDGVYVQNEDGSWGCDGLCDLDGFPITRDCDNEAIPGEDLPDGSKCRLLPPVVASLPGVVELPPGCEEALTAASLCAPSPANNFSCGDLDPTEINNRLTLFDVGGDDDLLWGKMCFLPQWDQDYDGVGDACDLCKFSYDPFNEPYVDENTGKLWDNIGRFCAGQYAPDAICEAAQPEEDDTGTETGGSGG